MRTARNFNIVIMSIAVLAFYLASAVSLLATGSMLIVAWPPKSEPVGGVRNNVVPTSLMICAECERAKSNMP